jgi:hypothetical protein
MTAPVAEQDGVAAAARSVAESASALARLELELAGLELKRKLGRLGLGVGLLGGAAVVALYFVGFAFASAAAGIATALPMWAALLIVTVLLALVAGGLGFVGVKVVQKNTPPVPEQAIEEARKTSDLLKSDDAG